MRTVTFKRIMEEEIEVELAEGVSAEQVQQRLDDLPPLREVDEIKDGTGKVLATVTGQDGDRGSWERTDDSDK